MQRSTRSPRRPIFLGLTILSIVIVLAAQAGTPLGPARILAGTFLVFFASGYAGILAARPRHLDGMSRLILSIPFSLVVAIIVGVVLDMTPIGLHTASLAVSLSVTTLLLLVIAWQRGSFVPSGGVAPSPALGRGMAAIRALSRLELGAIGLLLVAIVAAGVWTGSGIMRASQDVPLSYTELYLQHMTSRALPSGGGVAAVTVAVHNREQQDITYTVRTFVRHSYAPTGKLVLTSTLRVPRGKVVAQVIRPHFICGDAVQVQLFLPGKLPPAQWYPLHDTNRTDRSYRHLQVYPSCTGLHAPAAGHSK